jgi:hypothetical protein
MYVSLSIITSTFVSRRQYAWGSSRCNLSDVVGFTTFSWLASQKADKMSAHRRVGFTIFLCLLGAGRSPYRKVSFFHVLLTEESDLALRLILLYPSISDLAQTMLSSLWRSCVQVAVPAYQRWFYPHDDGGEHEHDYLK